MEKGIYYCWITSNSNCFTGINFALNILIISFQIGPWVLEWNNNAVILPWETQKWSSSLNAAYVLAALEIANLPRQNFFDQYCQMVKLILKCLLF